MPGGVLATPEEVGVNEQLHITYDGLLSRRGADKIYLRVGYGQSGHWFDIRDYEMRHTESGWEAYVPIHRSGQLNFCFRDRAANWDNNSGRNWDISVSPNRFSH